MRQGAERSRLGARRRPTRAEIEPAALALLQKHGATIMATARRFAATPEDAEDAYQRGVEILLTKAPTTAEEELVPWLRTVVKHEAWALRRQRQRAAPVADDGHVPEPPSEPALTHDHAERIDRLRIGAEALKQLKPQEIRALVLRAEGYSYKQIQEITGWTYTKVNRCLTEGRKAFLERVAGIEAGSECERLAPLLSKLADGEATAAASRRCGRTSAPACRAARRCASSAAHRQPRRRSFRRRPSRFRHAPASSSSRARAAETLAGWVQKAQAAGDRKRPEGGRRRRLDRRAGWRRRGHGRPRRARCRAAEARGEGRARYAGVASADLRGARDTRLAHRGRRAGDAAAVRGRTRAREAKRRTPPEQQEFEPAWAAGEPAPSTATATAVHGYGYERLSAGTQTRRRWWRRTGIRALAQSHCAFRGKRSRVSRIPPPRAGNRASGI